MDKKYLRSLIFRHLDGLVTAPVMSALIKKDVLSYLLKDKEIDITTAAQELKASEGYLNVALRVLAAQNYLDYAVDNSNNTVTVSVNQNTESAFGYTDLYNDLATFLNNPDTFKNADFSEEFCNNWTKLFDKYADCETLKKDAANNNLALQVKTHVEGVLVGPLIVRLGMSGLFHKYFMEASFSADEFHKNPQHFQKILERLVKLGWFSNQGKNYKFTDVGLFFARRATSYGVTVSYLPMFSRLDELLFGAAENVKVNKVGEEEMHVNREMNVWGSGGAHATYFKVVDEFIIDIFNRPLAEQPKGILDMGCGNGALLQHLYEVVERQTLRGKHLDEHPLFLVGADYNVAALKVTRANLIKNDIWAKVIWGDIGDPQRLANDLKTDYDIELGDLLNMRTFLDHNRIWEDVLTTDTKRVSQSTGAFAYKGKRLSNNAVEENLKLHLQKWAPYVEKFGLMLIELHTLNPNLTAKNLGKTAATAYDATHGFSDQYIVEVDVFHKICKESGLQPDENLFKKFPDSELATVSINLLKK